MKAMRPMDVRAWLLTHGFDEKRRRLVSKYEGQRVFVDLGTTGGSSWIVLDGSEHPLRKFNYVDLRLNGDRMLLGAGLRSFFLERMQMGAAAPSWFPDDPSQIRQYAP